MNTILTIARLTFHEAWRRRMVLLALVLGATFILLYRAIARKPAVGAPGGRWPSGSAADAVADVRGLRRVDHPHDLQLDARRQPLEQPSATTEQHRDLMDLQLVQHPGLERPLRRVRAMHHHVSVPGGETISNRGRQPVAQHHRQFRSRSGR